MSVLLGFCEIAWNGSYLGIKNQWRIAVALRLFVWLLRLRSDIQENAGLEESALPGDHTITFCN